MDKIILYHGSSHIIEKPTRGLGNPKNDYGLAFYCTREIEMAKEWAVTNNDDGYANEYSFEMKNLDMLDLNDGSYNILNWLAILIANREFRMNAIARQGRDYLLSTFLPDIGKYDLIRGYRADDSYFAFANAFLNNSMPLEVLEDVLKLGALGEQYAIVSQRAFDNLSFNGYHEADRRIYYPKKKNRDDAARNKYREDYTDIIRGTFLMDILRERWEPDDSRIRRIIY